jgi:hypothetical protein
MFNALQNKLLATLTLVVALAAQTNPASAESDGLKSLSAQWWQWALSIPASQNPLVDATGANCMVGQRGTTWFLAGLFGSGGPIIRNCTVPDSVNLFFPVVNSVNLNSPNVCGQGPANIPVADLRAGAAPFIDGSINLLVEVDGKPLTHLRRVQSKVFAAALPEDNIFDSPCVSAGGVPAGVYSPAIDDGVYAHIGALKAGPHTLHIHAENPSAGFVLEITYNLNVISISDK